MNLKSMAMLGFFASFSVAAIAEPVAHFDGKNFDTLGDAVSAFHQYNQRLERLVGQPELSAQDMSQIHELTYTLENAIERMQAELEVLAETLEEVHLASEANDAARIQKFAVPYLAGSEQLKAD